jgi:hypothetical protein
MGPSRLAGLADQPIEVRSGGCGGSRNSDINEHIPLEGSRGFPALRCAFCGEILPRQPALTLW